MGEVQVQGCGGGLKVMLVKSVPNRARKSSTQPSYTLVVHVLERSSTQLVLITYAIVRNRVHT